MPGGHPKKNKRGCNIQSGVFGGLLKNSEVSDGTNKKPHVTFEDGGAGPCGRRSGR